jgi:hypothetical protein
MVACRLFVAALAAAGLTAASASAQCGSAISTPYPVSTGYGMPGCGAGGCAVGGCGAAMSPGLPGCGSSGCGVSGYGFAPAGMTGTVVASDSGRRGLFGGRLFGRRSSSSGIVQAGYGYQTAMASPIAPAIYPTPTFAPSIYQQPIHSQPVPTTGTAVAGGTLPEGPAAVTGTPIIPAAGTAPAPIGIAPVAGPVMPYPPMGTACGGCPTTCDPCSTSGSGRRGLFGRFRR